MGRCESAVICFGMLPAWVKGKTLRSENVTPKSRGHVAAEAQQSKIRTHFKPPNCGATYLL